MIWLGMGIGLGLFCLAAAVFAVADAMRMGVTVTFTHKFDGVHFHMGNPGMPPGEEEPPNNDFYEE